MKTTGKLAAVALLVVALVVALLKWGGESASLSPRAASLASEPESEVPVLKVGVTSDSESRAVVEPVHDEATQAVPEPLPIVERSAPEFWGRVVAADDGLPIAGARIRTLDDSFEPRESGRDGLFEVPIDGLSLTSYDYVLLGKQEDSIEIEHADFGPVRIAISPGHSTPETALEIPLTRAAAWTVTVVDGEGQAVVDARVHLLAKSYEMEKRSFGFSIGPDWQCEERTGPDGVCRFVGLPSEVTLDVDVDVEGLPTHREPSPLVLAPGGETERTIRIGSGTLVRGLLLDQDGAPVAGQGIWLFRDMGGDPRQPTYFFGANDDEIVQRARTREDGRFELSHVASGAWWIAPAAERSDSRPIGKRISPLGTLLRIEPGELEREIVLHAHRGGAIRGVVLAPDGTPAECVGLFATSKAYVGGSFANTDKHGAFTLGPLSPGSFEIQTFAAKFASCAPLTAQTGDENLIVRLCAGNKLILQAIDPSNGEPCAAEYRFCGSRPDSGMVMVMSSSYGVSTRPQEIKGLAEGPYDVIAITEDGRIGVARALQARPESEAVVDEIPVARGGTLEIRYTGPAEFCEIDVFDGDSYVARDGLRNGTFTIKIVPVGRLRVEARLPSGSVQEQWIDTAPDGRHPVSFTFE